MAFLSITGPISCKGITSFPALSFSATYNSCNVSIPGKLTTKFGSHSNSLSSFSYRYSCHRNLYSEKQRGLALIAFDGNNSESEGEDDHVLNAVLKLYSSLKNKNIHELSADEGRRVSSFLSFLEALPGRTIVLEFFSYLTSIFDNNIQIIFKPTPQDGINVGIQWKFERNKIHIPIWKCFSLQITHTYHGRAVIRNIETFVEPLLHLKPFGLKLKIEMREFMEKIKSFMVLGSGNKAKRIVYLMLAASSLAAFLFFMKLAS